MDLIKDGLPHETRMDVVKILENHRRECERSGDYQSAEVTRKRLQKLRLLHEEKQGAALASQQDQALDTLRAENEAKWRAFDLRWEEELPKLEQQLEKMRLDLAERQAVELHRFQSLQASEQYKPKTSARLLSEKRRLEAMGAQGDYGPAKELKASIEKREEEELLRAHRSKLKGWQRREKRFREQQAREQFVLEEKVKLLRAKKARQKEKEAASMHRRENAQLSALRAAHTVLQRKAKSKPPGQELASILPPLV